MLAVSLSLAVPARANLFNIKHVEPSPLPEGQWNFTSGSFAAFSIPSYDGIELTARCRYVAPRQPYVWQFTFHNLTSNPISLNAALIQYNNGRFATVGQIYTTIERSSIRPVLLSPKGKAAIEEPGRYGCPGMEGGVNKDKHYVVIVDDVMVGSQAVRTGVFDAYDSKIVAARRAYAEGVSSAMAGGASAGFNSIFGPMQYDVPTTPQE